MYARGTASSPSRRIHPPATFYPSPTDKSAHPIPSVASFNLEPHESQGEASATAICSAATRSRADASRLLKLCYDGAWRGFSVDIW